MDQAPPVVSTEALEAYMTKAYPAKSVCELLSKVAPLRFREFSFSVPRINCTPPEEYVVRHLSFDDPDGLVAEIVKRSPSRVDVGAVWTCEPQAMALGEVDDGCYRTCAREVVFDIDIDAYDKKTNRARMCCSGSLWCDLCWPIVTIGCVVATQRLRDVGASSFAWFYSGRRGMHCWVCDDMMSWFGNAERSALFSVITPPPIELVASALRKKPDPSAMATVGYLSGVLPPASDLLLSEIFPPESDYSRPEPGGEFLGWYAHKHPECAFTALLEAAIVLRVDEGNAIMCKLRWTMSELEQISVDRLAVTSSMVRDLVAEVTRSNEIIDPWNGESYDTVAAAVALAAVNCLMPRFDVNVTPEQNHLLRCPMTVNPMTGMVAMYVENRYLRSFFPTDDCPMLVGTDKKDGTPLFSDKGMFDQSVVAFNAWLAGSVI